MNKCHRTSCVSALAEERSRLEKVVKAYDSKLLAYKNFRNRASKELDNVKAALDCISETGDEI